MSTQLTCFAIGATVGAVVALLFAPKSGRELRQDVADVTRKGVDRARETGSQLSTRAGEYYETAASKAGELASSARRALRLGHRGRPPGLPRREAPHRVLGAHRERAPRPRRRSLV
jgi:hypothetical protein